MAAFPLVRNGTPYRRLTLLGLLAVVALFVLGPFLVSVSHYTANYAPFVPFTHKQDQSQDYQSSSDSIVSQDEILTHESHFCTPDQYSDGFWLRRPEFLLRPMLNPDDVYPISRFQGCASTREVNWHLARTWGEDEEERSRNWRGNVSAYDWIPGEGCQSYIKPTPEDLVTQLVERGGWLILGDSISEGHFFSLSCMLYPHVRATPDYTQSWGFDRAWQQDLFLNKSSPLVPFLRYPEGFDIETTPLVTFRRVDLLLSKAELTSIFHNLTSFDANDDSHPQLFSDEGVWDLDPNTYLALFRKQLPFGNYNTAIFSTAGHWVTSLFSHFHDTNVEGDGLANLLKFFEKAMDDWLRRIEQTLDEVNTELGQTGLPRKQAIVRAYTPGHDGCHYMSVLSNGPVKQYEASMSHSYNWGWIRRYNDVFKSLIQNRNHPYIHFLSIDGPALLRPDGHVTGDCLHILTGAGIMEGWSEYISYFLNSLPY